jgi:hypothetical protein
MDEWTNGKQQNTIREKPRAGKMKTLSVCTYCMYRVEVGRVEVDERMLICSVTSGVRRINRGTSTIRVYCTACIRYERGWKRERWLWLWLCWDPVCRGGGL